MNRTDNQQNTYFSSQFFPMPFTETRLASALGLGISGFFICGIIRYLYENDFLSSGMGGALLLGIVGGYFRDTCWKVPSYRELGPEEPVEIYDSEGISRPNGKTLAGAFKEATFYLSIFISKPVGDFFTKNQGTGAFSYALIWAFMATTLLAIDWEVVNNRSDYEEIPSEENTSLHV